MRFGLICLLFLIGMNTSSALIAGTIPLTILYIWILIDVVVAVVT